MDDVNAFERQVAGEVIRAAAPARPVDAAAVFSAIPTATRSPKWRFQSMFSATKFVVAGAIVAMFGGVLLVAQPFERKGASVPGAADEASDIAFVQATYDWDGSKDAYGEPMTTAEDQRIMAVPSTGGDSTLFVSVPASDRQLLVGRSTVGPAVRWAPDGSRIAFRLYNDAPGIYVMDRDGSDLTRLTDLPEPEWRRWTPPNGGFAWSPDGTQIAFTSPRGTGSSPLYVVDTRDGRLTVLTDDDTHGGALPPVVWSPDGSRILYARMSGPLRVSTNSVFVINADGTGERRLLEVREADIHGVLWSPDGSRIAIIRSFEESESSMGDGGLWIADADGTGLRLVATGPWAGGTEVRAVHDGPVAWSPDGSQIATAWGGGITLIAVDGSGERVLDLDLGEAWIEDQGWSGVDNLSWSPDGSQLVFSDSGGVTAESPPTWDPPSIHVINADGTGLRWLADGEYPDWAK